MSYEENLAIIAAASEVLRNIFNTCEYKIDSHYGSCCDGSTKLRKAMTAYHWDGNGENPNRPFMSCELHYQEYHEYWSDMWQEYYSSIL